MTDKLQFLRCLLPLLLTLITAIATGADSTPPNIVLIISDDQSYTDYGFMDHPAIETPHLDQLTKSQHEVLS